jgi:hypothetical protein
VPCRCDRFEPAAELDALRRDIALEASYNFALQNARAGTGGDGEAPPAPDDELPSIGGYRMERSIADFVRACRVQIRDEQQKPDCDTALIGLLSDAVRMTREYDIEVRRSLKTPTVITELRGEVAGLTKQLGDEREAAWAVLRESQAEVGRLRGKLDENVQQIASLQILNGMALQFGDEEKALRERAEAECGRLREDAALRDRAIMNAIEATVVACDKDEREGVPHEARVVDYAGILARSVDAARFSPATPPIKFVADPSVPPGELHAVQDGKVVAKIVNLGTEPTTPTSPSLGLSEDAPREEGKP